MIKFKYFRVFGLAALSVCLWTAAARSPLSSQGVTLDDLPHCATCEIKAEHVLTLGNDLGEPGSVSSPYSLTRAPTGEIYAFYGGILQIFVHDESGEVLRRIGRKGGGPGEFRGLLRLRFDDDGSLHVFDRGNLRRTIFEPAADDVRHSTPVTSGAWDFLPFGTDRVIMNANIRTRESLGQPMHLIDSSGAVAQSFGVQTAVYRPDFGSTLMRRLGPATDSTFWAASINTWLVEEWSTSGRLVRSFSYGEDPDFLPTWHQTRSLGPETPPRPKMMGVREDASGNVWLVTQTPQENWQAALEEARSREGVYYHFPDRSQGFDTVVEVLDPSGRRIIARDRFDHAFGKFVGQDLHVVRTRSDRQGRVYAEIWRLSLADRRQ